MSQEALQQLSIIEQSLSNAINQKQVFEKQLIEIENALKEIEGAKEAYQIVGTVMLKKTGTEIKKSLEERRQTYGTRVKALAKQEETLRAQAQKLQDNIMSQLEKKK